MMKYITSLQNSEIKELVALQSAKGRDKLKKCLFQGIRTIETALNSSLRLDKLYSTEESLSKIVERIPPDKIVIVSEQVAQKISTVKESSGLVATFFIPITSSRTPLTDGVVLAQINDPGNMGTLIRTAAACGVKNVVIIEGTDVWSPKVIQSSVGTVAAVTIFDIAWSDLLVIKKNVKLCGLVVKEGISLKKLEKQSALIVIGNEAHGLPLEWQKDCDYLVTLPMPGNTESLNAAVAGSIALYLMYVDY